ncbi:MAG TPA: hydroxymethylbilane synthase [Actinomycetota bacterium]
MTPTTLRIGTRRSALATAQADLVAQLLRTQGLDAQLVPITTSGDEGAPADASPQGLKGLWIDKIVDALRHGEIDVAVHSAKDLPAEDEEDLVLGAVPWRADPTDVVVLRDADELKPGMVVGTSSVRRKAQLLASFPGVGVTDLRGNVDTRLRKVARGTVDAAVLAAAGLARLGLEPTPIRRLSLEEMVPAPGQGCLAIQCRAEDRTTRARLQPLDHRPSHLALDAERALMRRLGGGCALPLGAIAAVKGDTVRLVGLVAAPDGAEVIRAAADARDPEHAAERVAERLVDQGARRILAEVRAS